MSRVRAGRWCDASTRQPTKRTCSRAGCREGALTSDGRVFGRRSPPTHREHRTRPAGGLRGAERFAGRSPRAGHHGVPAGRPLLDGVPAERGRRRRVLGVGRAPPRRGSNRERRGPILRGRRGERLPGRAVRQATHGLHRVPGHRLQVGLLVLRQPPHRVGVLPVHVRPWAVGTARAGTLADHAAVAGVASAVDRGPAILSDLLRPSLPRERSYSNSRASPKGAEPGRPTRPGCCSSCNTSTR